MTTSDRSAFLRSTARRSTLKDVFVVTLVAALTAGFVAHALSAPSKIKVGDVQPVVLLVSR